MKTEEDKHCHLIKAERSPLRLRSVERLDPESGQYSDTYSGARWTRQDITTANHWNFMSTLAGILRCGNPVPKVPETLVVRLRPKEFARLLSHERADVRDWVMLNLTARYVKTYRSKSVVRGSIAARPKR